MNKTILFAIPLLALVLTGCDTKKDAFQPSNEQPQEESTPDDDHIHTFSDTWSHDETYHWHDATCGHDVISNKGLHTFSSWIVETEATEESEGLQYKVCTTCFYRVDEVIPQKEHVHTPGVPVTENMVAATCTTVGGYDIVTYCTKCNEVVSSNHVVLPATGHQHTHKVEENRTEATCTASGSYYLVTYCDDCGAELSRISQNIPAIGHQWGAPSYSWNFDGWSTRCTASRVCAHDQSHIESETVIASKTTVTEATYEKEGLERYTAIFANTAFETQIEEKVIPVKQMIKYTLSSDGTYYTASSDSTSIYGDVVIPSEYNDLPVKVVGSFGLCSKITSITIPSSVEQIEGSSFSNCTNLSEVHLSEGLLSIGSWAFSNCALTEISVPNSVRTIGNYAFDSNSALISAEFGTGITTFGESVLSSCNSLQSLTIPFVGETKTTKQYIAYLFGYLSETYNSWLPASLTTITVLDTCEQFSNVAFKGCSKLVNINLPFIGETKTTNLYLGYVFGGASADDNTTVVPASLKKVVVSDVCPTIGEKAFAGCETIEHVSLGNSISSIGYRAFHGCNAIESLTIPASVTSIGNSAFGNMSSLLSVNILSKNLTIGLSVFSGSSALVSIKVPDDCNNYSTNTALYNKDKTRLICCPGGYSGSFVVPDSVVEIEEYAFYSCKLVTSVSMSNNVTTIGKNTFTYCEGLKSVTLSNKITDIPQATFACCYALESIDIPSGVTSIGGTTFGYCSSLTDISISNTVTDIGTSAFLSCTSLQNVILSSSIKDIKQGTFMRCSALTSISLPSGITTIGSVAFGECTALSSINIPNTVTTIETSAFYKCTSLESISLPDSVITLGDAVFEQCTALKSFVFPYKITTISKGLFQNCKSLKSVDFSTYDYVYVGEYAFYGCNKLETIEIAGIKTIGKYAFANCSSLSSVGLDSTLTSIGDYGFYYCYSLYTFIFAGTVSQWNSVTKGSNWNSLTLFIEVQCSNGTVPTY